MFHSFGSMCSFFLSVIVREDVDDSHEVYLLLHSTWHKKHITRLYLHLKINDKVAADLVFSVGHLFLPLLYDNCSLDHFTPQF